MRDLSIIIVSYNTESLTHQCLLSLLKSLENSPKTSVEIIVVDNASKDGSIEMLKKHGEPRTENRELKIIECNENLGFSKANNIGLAAASGRYILFLNSDIIVENVNFTDLVYYMDKNKNVGILTISVVLKNGKPDMASHRGFPTIWNSFTYFSRLEKIFSKIPRFSKYFGGYHMTHLNLNTIHEIDSPSGAFFFTRKDIMDKVGGFDVRFFMYGEDLDLSYRIKKQGFIAVYYPLFKVIHLKYKSGIKKGIKKTESKTRGHFYDAMKIFYDKHFAQKNGPFKNRVVHFFIDIKSRISK